jgi:hypothetical protein
VILATGVSVPPLPNPDPLLLDDLKRLVFRVRDRQAIRDVWKAESRELPTRSGDPLRRRPPRSQLRNTAHQHMLAHSLQKAEEPGRAEQGQAAPIQPRGNSRQLRALQDLRKRKFAAPNCLTIRPWCPRQPEIRHFQLTAIIFSRCPLIQTGCESGPDSFRGRSLPALGAALFPIGAALFRR